MKSDILAILGSQVAAPSMSDRLPLISVWNPCRRLLMFFTLAADPFASHYADNGKFKFHCLGDGCPACAVGIRTTEHLYVPVWDVESRRIVALCFHLGPNGPASQILQFLSAYRDQLAEVVAVIECEGNGKIRISAHAVVPETDCGAIECEGFCRGLETGAISLKSCVRLLSAGEIAALPEVKCKGTPQVGGLVAPKRHEQSDAGCES